jgi:hypothetical protein
MLVGAVARMKAAALRLADPALQLLRTVAGLDAVRVSTGKAPELAERVFRGNPGPAPP